jgi:hypothetical protein
MTRRGKNKRPPPMFEKVGGRLIPASAYDEEVFMDFPAGTEFDCVPRSNRRTRHHNLYWRTLGATVKATGMWATDAHLHIALKWATGYVLPIWNPDDGKVVFVDDSIAFDAMNQQEFEVYFRVAMLKLSEWIGADPLTAFDD